MKLTTRTPGRAASSVSIRRALAGVPRNSNDGKRRESCLHYWLSVACKAVREGVEEGVPSLATVARLAGVEKSTISNIEAQKVGWPRDPETIVAAYAKAAAWPDSRKIWELALTMWQEHGEDATLPDRRSRQAPVDMEAELERIAGQINASLDGS